MNARIFVSHARSDTPLVEPFVKDLMMVGCGVQRGDIYCSSLDGMGTLAGDPNFIDVLRNGLQNAKLIILMLSPNYYSSEYCLAELGATWMLKDVAIFPLLIPPQDRVKGILQVTQAKSIKDVGHLADLHFAVLKACNIEFKSTSLWERQKVLFLASFDSFLKNLGQPDRVSRSEYEEERNRANVYKELYDELQRDINSQKIYIDQLEKLKDHHEVARVKIENLGELEQFDELRNNVNEELRKLPKIVAKAFYYYLKGETVPLEDSEERFDAEIAEEEGYFRKDTQGMYDEFIIVEKRLDIADALDAISSVRSFLYSASSEFKTALYYEEGYKPSLDIKPFWDKYIYYSA